MNGNEMNNDPSENQQEPSANWNEQDNDNGTEQGPQFPGFNENDEDAEGLTFNWTSLFVGLAFFFFMFHDTNIFSGDWSFLLYLFAAVIIHEMGHVIFGRLFGCEIKEMQVFFFPFASYKPRQTTEGSSWRNVKWSLGALPLGGATVFKSRASDAGGTGEKPSAGYAEAPAASPYIEDKAAWQRLLISAAGVLFNLATFLILYLALPYLSAGSYHFFSPLAILSLILAILNILPIYPLDGGAIVFALYEIITGRKPSPEFTRICSWIGFAVIILLFWVFPQWINGLLESILWRLF